MDVPLRLLVIRYENNFKNRIAIKINHFVSMNVLFLEENATVVIFANFGG